MAEKQRPEYLSNIKNFTKDIVPRESLCYRLDSHDLEIEKFKQENESLKVKNQELEKRLEHLEKLF